MSVEAQWTLTSPAAAQLPLSETDRCEKLRILFNRMLYSVLTQHQYISLLATYFYKTTFSPILAIGRYIQYVHTLWDYFINQL